MDSQARHLATRALRVGGVVAAVIVAFASPTFELVEAPRMDVRRLRPES